MTKTDIQITRFEDGHYWVDIVDSDECYDSWLTHKNMGIAQHMFGVPKMQSDGRKTSYDEFCDLVENNLQEEKLYYINEYSENDPWIIDG